MYPVCQRPPGGGMRRWDLVQLPVTWPLKTLGRWISPPRTTPGGSCAQQAPPGNRPPGKGRTQAPMPTQPHPPLGARLVPRTPFVPLVPHPDTTRQPHAPHPQHWSHPWCLLCPSPHTCNVIHVPTTHASRPQPQPLYHHPHPYPFAGGVPDGPVHLRSDPHGPAGRPPAGAHSGGSGSVCPSTAALRRASHCPFQSGGPARAGKGLPRDRAGGCCCG